MFDKLLRPRFPPCAAGIEQRFASVVQLDRSRGSYVIKRAASLNLSENVIHASFDETNVTDPAELIAALTDLVTSAGLLRQRKWSVALPEATVRSAILTIEGSTGSRREVEEVLEWKIERSFGAPVSELRLAREELSPNAQKQARYLVTALRLSVLAEYEAVFSALGWHAGLILPRHAGEQQWLKTGTAGDGLLLSSHDEGFTAVLLRNDRPLTLRTIYCEKEECDDEIHRVLLFYRERSNSNGQPQGFNRVLVMGDRLDKARVSEIARETLGVSLHALDAADVGLLIPGNLPFEVIAAPAGLARLAW